MTIKIYRISIIYLDNSINCITFAKTDSKGSAIAVAILIFMFRKQYTYINLLCALIIVLMAASVVLPVYRFSVAFGYGFAAGIEAQGSNEEIQSIPVEVQLKPTKENLLHPSDSIQSPTGEKYPMVVKQAVVMEPLEKANTVAFAFSLIFSLVSIAIVIYLIYCFISFVVKINKGEIFSSVNVKLLARIGCLMIINCLIVVAANFTQASLARSIQFESADYSVSVAWLIPFTDAMLGLFALMLAAIWKKGIILQQDQELTI